MNEERTGLWWQQRNISVVMCDTDVPLRLTRSWWTSFCLSFLWLRILITPLASLSLLFGWSFVQLFSIILEFCLDGMHGLTIKTIERWTKSETIFIIMIDDLFKCRPSYIHVNYCCSRLGLGILTCVESTCRLHHFTKRGGLTSNPSLIMPHFIVQFLCQIRSVSD
jgi:hypothetical protein